MNASVESLVLIKNYDKLQTMIKGGILEISSRSVAQHLLSSGEHSKCTHMLYTDEQKAMFFMQVVRNRVEVDSTCFGSFLGVLKQEPSYKFMTDKLEKEVEEMKNNRPGSEAGAGHSIQPSCGATINDHSGDDDDYEFVDDTTVLGDDDYVEVVTELMDLAVRFSQLGKVLRIPTVDMEIIKVKHRDDPKEGLSAVVEAWLNHNSKRVPTWKALVKAVAHPFGGYNGALARKIAAKYPARVAQASS